MRAVECVLVPKCVHVHAPDDEQLAQELKRHAASVHPEIRYPIHQAREFVESSGYRDTAHAKRKRLPPGSGDKSVALSMGVDSGG